MVYSTSVHCKYSAAMQCNIVNAGLCVMTLLLDPQSFGCLLPHCKLLIAAAFWDHTTLLLKATGWVHCHEAVCKLLWIRRSVSRGPVCIPLGLSAIHHVSMQAWHAMTCCIPDISSSFLLGLDVAAVLPCNAQLHLFTLLLLVFCILLVVNIKKSATVFNIALEP